MDDHPYVYPYSLAEARRLGEEQKHEDSFRLNVECARAIERAIREHFNEAAERLEDDCAQPVLDQYGFARVKFVLANSVKEMGMPHLLSDAARSWAAQTFVPPDGKYTRYFAADTAASLLEEFIQQTRDAYQALGLFGPEHCIGNELDYKGRVLVLSPDTLRESCWDARNQLWLGEGGFGCSPTSLGRAVYATCLGDGEQTRWDRSDFTGVLDEQYLPDWAVERLEELRGSRQEQSGPTMGGMKL